MNRLIQGKTLPILTVVAIVVVIWYACVVWLNAPAWVAAVKDRS